MTRYNPYRPVATTNSNEVLHRRQLADACNRLGDAKHNGTGTVNLSTATSTVITDQRIGSQTVLVLMALTANAAIAQSTSPGIYQFSVGDHTMTIAHATATVTDRTYSYLIGG